MADKESRGSIIDSVSNWLKLFALIILVAEAMIMFAMSQTPVESPIYPWYPFVMLFLLLLIIIAVFVDRILDRNSKKISVSVENKELTINPEKSKIKTLDKEPSKYVNGLLGYSFDKMTGEQWNAPREISFKEYIQQIFLVEDINDDYLQSLVSANNPFGMLLFHANILEVQHGKPIVIEMDESSTTEAAEHSLSKIIELKALEGTTLTNEEVIALRKQLNRTDEISAIGFGVTFNVMTFKKGETTKYSLPLGLPNLFMTLSLGNPEQMDSLTSGKEMILWTTSNKLKDVIIDGERIKSFHVYRLYQLVENQNYIYLCQAQWSPHIESAAFSWEELKKAFESFKIEK